jgi:hypothetical protein
MGLTAVELIPIYAYTQQAVRSTGLDIEASARFSLNETSLWQLLDPLIAGGPEQLTSHGQLYWETVCHFGLALSLLAVLGVLGGWQRPGVKRLSITLGLCALFGLGTATPFFSLMFYYVPGISLFRGSSRILMHLSLFVSLLAGFGLQALFAGNSEQLSRKPPSWASWLVAIASAAILVIGVWNPAGWPLHPPGSDSLQKFNATTIGLGAGGFLGLWLMASFGRGNWAILAAALAIAVVTAEHTRHANRVLRVVPPERFRSDSEIVQFLKTHAGDSRVLASQDLISDGEAWRQGISKVHGYEPVPPVRAVIMIDAITPHREPQDELIGLQPVYPNLYRQNVLDLLGVEYAVVPAGGPKLPESWELAASGEVPPVVALAEDLPSLRYEIWRNRNALPRSFVLGEMRLIQAEIPHSQQLAQCDPRKFVLVSQDVLPSGPRQPFREATIVESSPNQLTIEAELDSPGYLVVSDLIAPGWRAKVNGTPNAIVPANVSFRGVPLPAGKHQVTLTYTPPGLWFGALAMVVTLLLLLASATYANREAS